jgi:hypothetical protein
MKTDFMDKRKIFTLSLIGSITAAISILYLGLGIPLPDSVISLQPSDAAVPAAKFLIPINEYPGLMLRFMTADSFLILGGILLYLGMYTVVSEKSRLIAAAGLGIGLLTILLDSSENAFLISYAQQSNNGFAVTNPAVPLLFVIANLKMVGSYAGFLIFGLAWPRQSKLEWTLSSVMILYTVTGVLSIVLSELILLIGIIIMVTTHDPEQHKKYIGEGLIHDGFKLINSVVSKVIGK